MAKILPAIFFGHGNPMNAVLKNVYTKAWRRMGRQLPKPRAILPSPPIGLFQKRRLRSLLRQGPSMTSADFPKNCFRSSIRRGAIRIWRAGFKNCSRRRNQARQFMGTRPRDMVRASARIS